MLSDDEVLEDASNPFGDWLRTERLKKGWKQWQLAEKAGISGQQVSNLETGRSMNPQATTRAKLEQALGETVPVATVEQARDAQDIAGLGSLTNFDPHDENDLPEVPGVYVFYDVSERPVYVGRSTKRTIAHRVREHYEKFWFKRPIVDSGAFIEIADEYLCQQVEQILIKFLKSNAVLNVKGVHR